MLRRLAIITALIIAVAGISACGEEKATHGETEGVYLNVGGVKYQVQTSRVLNPADVEDREYLAGVSDADLALKPDEDWFAVFIRAENESKSDSAQTASKFRIVDTTGTVFEPIVIDPKSNPHAYTAGKLGTESVYPPPNSTAGTSTTAGSLLLFKIPTDHFANRPLELHIASPTGSDEATVDLDV